MRVPPTVKAAGRRGMDAVTSQWSQEELELPGPPPFSQIEAQGQTLVPPLFPLISHWEASGRIFFLPLPSSLSFPFWFSPWRRHSDILKANKHSPSIFFLKKFTLRELAPWLTTVMHLTGWLRLIQVHTRPDSLSSTTHRHPQGLFTQYLMVFVPWVDGRGG